MIDNRLTDAGKKVIAMALADSQQYPIEFTKIKVGDGYADDSWDGMLDLIHPVKELEVSIKKIDKDTIAAKAILKNEEIETGFFYRELGLFAFDKNANKEVLVSYGNAGEYAEYIDGMNLATFKEKLITILIKLENISKMTVKVASGIYATQKDLERVKRKLDSIYNISKEEVDNIMEGIAAEEDEESFFEDKEYEEEIGEPITTKEIDTILKS